MKDVASSVGGASRGPWIVAFAVFAAMAMVLVSASPLVSAQGSEDAVGLEGSIPVVTVPADERGNLVSAADSAVPVPHLTGTVHSVYEGELPLIAGVDSKAPAPALTLSDDMYSYVMNAGKYEFSRGAEYDVRFYDRGEEPTILGAYFSVVTSPSKSSVTDVAQPSNPVVTSATAEEFAVAYELSKDGSPLGTMEVTVAFSTDSLPKFSAHFTSLQVDTHTISIVWIVRVPLGDLEIVGGEKLGLTVPWGPKILSPPQGALTVRVPGARSRTLLLDWADAGVASQVFAEPDWQDGHVRAGLLQIRFQPGVLTIDPTGGGSMRSSSSLATAYSSQRKLFYANGVYWAFWFDSAFKYAWSEDGLTWNPTQATWTDVDQSFDVVLSGGFAGIAYIDNTHTKLKFIGGSVQQKVITWQNPVQVATWTDTLFRPPSIAFSPLGGIFLSAIYAPTVGGTLTAYVYRSTNGGATFSQEFSLPGSDRASGPTPILASMSNGSVMWVHVYKTADILWQSWFGPGGWSDRVGYSLYLPTGYDRESRTSAVVGPDDVVHVVYVTSGSGGSTVSDVKVKPGSTPQVESVYSSGTSMIYPTASIDLNGDLHVFWVSSAGGFANIYYTRKGVSGWTTPATPFPLTSITNPAWLSAVTKSQTQLALVWTRADGSFYAVDAGILPLPTSVGPATFDPWSRSGLSPYQSYFSQLGDYVNPATGMLTIKQTDLVLPGRGLDVEVARVYQTPQAFISGVPYLYEVSPYGSLGLGWSLNLPWIGTSFVHLWDGQVVYVDWDSTGTTFVYSGAEGFKLVKDGSGYTLYAKSGTRYRFDTAGRVLTASDVSGANIVTYTLLADGRLDKTTDTVGRVVQFGYDASNRVSSVSTGSRTVSYTYTGPSQLWKVTDSLNRQTTLSYQATSGAGAYLPTRVTYPTGGFTQYSWEMNFPIQVGTEAFSYPVITVLVSLPPSTTVRYTNMVYEAKQGRVEFSEFYEFNELGVRQSSTEYNYRRSGLYSTTTKYDGSHAQVEKTRTWYGMQGAPVQTDFYAGNSANPTYSTTVAYDEWGNQMAARDPLGHETFASYLNTKTENEYKGTGSVSLLTDGKMLYDGFDDFDYAGWTTSGPGTVAVDDVQFEPTVPSIRINNPTYNTATVLSHTIPTQTSSFTFEGRVRVSKVASTPGIQYVLGTSSTGGFRVYLGFRENNKISYYSPVNTWIDCADYKLDHWYRVTVQVTASSTYNVYLDGNQVCSDAPFNSAGSIDTVSFEAAYWPSTNPSTLWVDEVKVFKGDSITITGLRPGQVAQLLEPGGSVIQEARSSATSQVLVLTGRSWDFAANNWHYYEFGPDVLRILSASRLEEYVAPFREFWGGSSLLYKAPLQMAGIARVESGFARYSTMYLDDDANKPAGTYTPAEDGWTFRYTAQETAVVGSQTHMSPWRTGTHQHYFTGAALGTPASGQFFIQYVRVKPDQYPAEVMLQFYSGTSWEHRAYWGGNYISLGTDGTASRRSMGMLPYHPDEWLMLIVKADDVGMNGLALGGLAYTLYGGAALWDASALGDSNTGLVRVGSVEPATRVDFVDLAGNLVATDTVGPNDNGVAHLDLYAAGVHAFPIEGKFKFYDMGWPVYTSPATEVYGGDRFTHTESDFYVNLANSVDPSIHNRAVGNMAYRTTTTLAPSLDLDMDTTTIMGEYKDMSFSGNHAAKGGAPALASGIVGNALDFDGIDDYLEVPDANTLDITGEISIGMWVYLDQDPNCDPNNNWRVLLTKRSGSGGDFGSYYAFLEETRGVSWSVTVGGVAQRLFTSSGVVPIGQWTYLVFTRDIAGVLRVYVNGLESTSAPKATGPIDVSDGASSALRIALGSTTGACPVGDGAFPGKIDEVMVTDRVLPWQDVEFVQRSQGGTGGQPYQKSKTTYDGWGRPTGTSVLHNGRWITTSNGYDAYGNLASVTDPLQHAITYEYSATYGSAYLTKITQPLGVVSTYTYDFATGMRTQEVDPNGGVTDYTYDNLLRILTTTYPSVGGVRSSITYTYDDVNNAVTIQDELGHKIKHTFDSIGRETKVERLNPGGSVYSTESFTYDCQDRVKTHTTTSPVTYTMEYDLFGRTTKVTNPGGSYRSVSYDDVNNIVTTTDEVGRKVRYTYDRANQLFQVGEWDPASQVYNLTWYMYDGMGSLTRTHDADGKEVNHFYDDLGRVVATIYPDAVWSFERYTYDDDDNLATKTKRDGVSISYAYNSLDRMTRITYPGNYLVDYAYDAVGNTKRIANSNATLWYEYDARNRVTKESSLVDGTNSSIMYSYDAASNMETMTYPDNSVFTYAKDDFNRLRSVQSGGATYGSFSYRTDDRLSTATFGNGVSTTYSYDNRVRPSRILSGAATSYTLRPNTAGSSTQWTPSTAGGQNWQMVDDVTSDGDSTYVKATTAGKTDTYGVADVSLVAGETVTAVEVHALARKKQNGANIQLQLRVNSANSASTALTTSYVEYVATWTTNPGTGLAWTNSEINALQAGQNLSSISSSEARVTQLWVVIKTSKPFQDLGYQYNNAGDVTQLTIAASPVSQTETNIYDGQDRLLSWATAGTYSISQTFEYTAAGDRAFKAEGGQGTYYTYIEDHRLSAYQSTHTSGSFGYDRNGNRISKVEGSYTTTFSYDAEDRLTKVDENSAILGTYYYDGLGRRIKTVEGSTTTYFTYSGLSLAYTKVGSTQTRYIYAAGMLVARLTGVTPAYFHPDALGSTRSVTDAAGAIIFATQYKPFGAEYGTSGTNAKLEFTGQWTDTNTGLIYLYRRFYDPEFGRFLSQDRILGHLASPQSLNRYAYASNNPLRYVDPTGDDWWNPLTWGQDLANVASSVVGAVSSAASAVGDWWASSSIWDKLDAAMTVVGFIPGLDVISDAYFLGKSIVDVVQGRGSWADVAMNAAFMLMPAVGGAAIAKVAKKFLNVADGAGDAARALNKVDDLADGAKAINKADGIGDVAAKGGVYKLVDPGSGQVMRTGRTNNLVRRAAEHARDPALKRFDFQVIKKTDSYAEQRGLEQLAHDIYQPPLNKIRPISPTNPNRNDYMRAAFDFLARYGGQL